MNGHLNTLRCSQVYARVLGRRAAVRPSRASAGVRRKPRPEGRPGRGRLDSMHLGDFDNDMGVFHINGVEEVTQYQFAGCVESICEPHPLPVVERLLAAFPFVVRGFHSHNISHYVNRQGAALMEELGLREFVKPRQRPYNNDVSAESRDASMTCRQRGNEYFAGRHVEEWAPPPQKGLGT